jgi:hypothetical protein
MVQQKVKIAVRSRIYEKSGPATSNEWAKLLGRDGHQKSPEAGQTELRVLPAKTEPGCRLLAGSMVKKLLYR